MAYWADGKEREIPPWQAPEIGAEESRKMLRDMREEWERIMREVIRKSNEEWTKEFE